MELNFIIQDSENIRKLSHSTFSIHLFFKKKGRILTQRQKGLIIYELINIQYFIIQWFKPILDAKILKAHYWNYGSPNFKKCSEFISISLFILSIYLYILNIYLYFLNIYIYLYILNIYLYILNIYLYSIYLIIIFFLSLNRIYLSIYLI